ncbi:hypothetical protein C8R42DRAFT_415420 [Lentinula raphanica]|nr:hypothetical protein C8R42DRAFT_415420 [Lentinula raphanica]
MKGLIGNMEMQNGLGRTGDSIAGAVAKRDENCLRFVSPFSPMLNPSPAEKTRIFRSGSCVSAGRGREEVGMSLNIPDVLSAILPLQPHATQHRQISCRHPIPSHLQDLRMDLSYAVSLSSSPVRLVGGTRVRDGQTDRRRHGFGIVIASARGERSRRDGMGWVQWDENRTLQLPEVKETKAFQLFPSNPLSSAIRTIEFANSNVSNLDAQLVDRARTTMFFFLKASNILRLLRIFISSSQAIYQL